MTSHDSLTIKVLQNQQIFGFFSEIIMQEKSSLSFLPEFHFPMNLPGLPEIRINFQVFHIGMNPVAYSNKKLTISSLHFNSKRDR